MGSKKNIRRKSLESAGKRVASKRTKAARQAAAAKRNEKQPEGVQHFVSPQHFALAVTDLSQEEGVPTHTLPSF